MALNKTQMQDTPMNTDATPVKPAMTDEEAEAMIAEYLTRRVAPIYERTKSYTTITATVGRFAGEAGFSAYYSCYTEPTGTLQGRTAGDAIGRIAASLGDVRTAKRLREEAAEKIARAEQIEAAAMGSEVAKGKGRRTSSGGVVGTEADGKDLTTEDDKKGS